MRPSQTFESSLHQLRALHALIGQDIFAGKFRRSPNFYIIALLMFAMLLCNGIDLLCTDDLGGTTRIIQASIFIGAAQTLLKFYWFADLRPLGLIFTFVQDIHSENSQPGDKYYALCQHYTRLTAMMTRVIYATFAGLLVFIWTFSLIESCSTQKPILLVYFPFVHEYSVVQLMLLNMYITVVNWSCPLYLPVSDVLFAIVVANMTMIPSVIATQLSELSGALQQRLLRAADIKRHWVQYILVHQKYNRYSTRTYLVVNNMRRIHPFPPPL